MHEYKLLYVAINTRGENAEFEAILVSFLVEPNSHYERC